MLVAPEAELVFPVERHGGGRTRECFGFAEATSKLLETS